MFHAAWPASHRPAFSPTRGSGLGAADALGAGTGALPPVEEAHEARAAPPSASANERTEDRTVAMSDSRKGVYGRTRVETVNANCGFHPPSPPASSACV